MYPLEFKDIPGQPPYTYSRNWTYAVEPREILGTVVLLAASDCIQAGSSLQLVPFDAEPEAVDQVFLASWVGERLTLKDVRGLFLEYDGEWACKSNAVTSRGLFEVSGEFTFTSTHQLEIGGHTEFKVLVEYKEPTVETLSREEIEAKAGRPLTDAELVELYRSDDGIHAALAALRDQKGSRV